MSNSILSNNVYNKSIVLTIMSITSHAVLSRSVQAVRSRTVRAVRSVMSKYIQAVLSRTVNLLSSRSILRVQSKSAQAIWQVEAIYMEQLRARRLRRLFLKSIYPGISELLLFHRFINSFFLVVGLFILLAKKTELLCKDL